MNGVSIPIHATRSSQDEGITEMLNFLEKSQSISDWGNLQARALFETIPVWRKEPFIRLKRWEEKFALPKVKATSRSVQMFKDYLGIDSFESIGAYRCD
jgi:hypothetical protein